MFKAELLEFLSLIISSAIVLSLIYLKFSVTTLQQIIALLLILLIFLARLFFTPLKPNPAKLVRLSLIFLSSMFVQVLVISSGGFYSPFLILIHLYALATSFLLNLQSSISFLGLTLLVLILGLFLDQKMSLLFQEDPGSVILYGISFLIIIPLAQFLMQTYHIKDTISKMLIERSRLSQIREESILQSLAEMILVTDKNLRILSVNEAYQKLFHQTGSELINKSLVEVLPLKDKNGQPIEPKSLSIENILTDKVTRIIKGYYLSTANNHSTEVIIQIRPITDSANQVNQMVFVITDAKEKDKYGLGHPDLNLTLTKYRSGIEDLKKTLVATNLPELQSRIEILSHIEEDLLTAMELEDHPIQKNTTLEDIAYLCKKIADGKGLFAQKLGISLQFNLPEEENAEYTLIQLRDKNISQKVLGISVFTTPVDIKWFQIAISRLVDLAIFLTLGSAKPSVEVKLALDQNQNVSVLISSQALISEQDKSNLFVKYYDGLEAKTKLSLGSGLEGFIAKSITDQLFIPLNVALGKYPDRVMFTLQLAKNIV
ncbi:PAS domain-containing protein [Candidatus Daviesbacteria bacterium]|nr:PAS domain-containing protein [Candidatus Daviesbacteria bacterium]